MSGKRSASVSSEAAFPVLFDGWPLANEPASPAAFHLLELIDALPEAVKAWVALPRAPDKPIHFKQAIQVIVEPTPDTPGGRLRWEQRALGQLARARQVRLIHTTTLHPPLFTPCPVVVSPAEKSEALSGEASALGGITERLRWALGQGGLNAVRAVLWPQDLPAPVSRLPFYNMPVTAHDVFSTTLPHPEGITENYVLVPGPLNEEEIDLLLAAWSWAAAGLGEDWTLLAVNLEESAQARLRERFDAMQFDGPLVIARAVSPTERAALYQHADCALLVGASVPWSSPALYALAAGCPIAAQERPHEDARIGPAGYLTPPGEARALGAAVLTIIVEETLGEALRESARKRAAEWNHAAFRDQLALVYAEVAPNGAGVLFAARQQDIRA